MPRKSTKNRAASDIRQTALRMREHEHAWLVEEAKGHHTTLNAEIMWRVMRTRDSDIATMERMGAQEAHASLAALGNDLQAQLDPYLISARERVLYGDVVFAARKIVDETSAQLAAGQLEGRTCQRLRAMIDNFHLARRDLEIAFGEKAISQGSPGFQARAEARLRAAGVTAPSSEESDR